MTIINLLKTIPTITYINNMLKEHNHIILKNANFSNSIELSENYGFLVGERMGYKQGTNSRKDLGGNVLNVGPEPPFFYVHQHNEMSYLDEWPSMFMLACLNPPTLGEGITPIADNRKITQNLPQNLKQKFINNKIKYYQTFTDKYGNNTIVYKHWQDAFFTDDKENVERQCRKKGYDYEWLEDGSFTLNYIRPGFIYHPTTGELLFFNAGFQNAVWFENWAPYNQLEKLKRPFFATWGNGEEFSQEELEILQNNSEKYIKKMSWERGMIILLDNHYYTHGRTPYTEKSKDREIGVIMGNKVRRVTEHSGISTSCYV